MPIPSLEAIQRDPSLLATLPRAEKEQILELLDELASRQVKKRARLSLLDFVMHVNPKYMIGRHHKHLAALLEAIARGEKDRICVNMAPRMGKSLLVSHYYPAWFIANYPDAKVMMVSHTADLAVDFGRKVRNLVGSEPYRGLFPDVELSQDSKSAGRWNTNYGGEYYACGVGGAIAGRGADLLLIDDPHNEQDIINGNLDIFDKAYEWYTTGARTRLQPGGRVALIQTRWSTADLTGRLVHDMTINEGADQFEIVEFPAILERDETVEIEEPEDPDDPTSPLVRTLQTRISQQSLWPEQWSLEALLRTKASMPSHQWNAQYMQDPTAEEGAIIKREWWRAWDRDVAPKPDFIVQAWDTAFEKTTRSDYSACTTWGVWYPESSPDDTTTGRANVILLDAFKDRMEFPELKQVAFKKFKEWEAKQVPMTLIVEKKASGAPLIYELRQMGLVVGEYTPSRGQDKIARLNSVSDMFSSGMVWAPRTRWAEDVIDEVASFPAGRHDDYVDSVTLALMRVRQGGFMRLPSDEPDEIKQFKSRRRAGYY
jgi:predicted phage terminase large subunit-like protein